MAQSKSTFARLQDNFKGLFHYLKCIDCGRKIDLQSKCFECESLFCTECLFQARKTKSCKQCKSIDTIKPIKNRNTFVDELLELIKMFENDTGMKLIKEDFENVETVENLERIFEKEKTSVFNQQKFIATSTPNINNLKKVVFNSDITMIPQNAKEPGNQIDSVEKSNTRRKTVDKSNSKRKADSLNEKSDESSKSKKAKVNDVSKANDVSEDEIPKENEIINEKETDKRTTSTKQTEKQSSARKNSKLQIKEMDDNQEINKKSIQQIKELEEQIKILEEEKKKLEDQHKEIEDQLMKSEDKFKQLEENNKHINEKRNHFENQFKQIEIDYKNMIEKNRQLDEKIRLIETKNSLEERSIKIMQEQLNKQTKEMNKIINIDRIQDMIIVGLTKIVSNAQQPISSSIEFDQLGKIDFTIQPFKVIEPPKKKTRTLEVQTDGILNGDIKKSKTKSISSQSSNIDVAIREVVNDVIDVCNGENKEGNDLPINKSQGNKSTNNFSVEFDESLITKETKNIPSTKQNGDMDEISSDELKKHVENDSLFEESDDEVAASSPIY